MDLLLAKSPHLCPPIQYQVMQLSYPFHQISLIHLIHKASTQQQPTVSDTGHITTFLLQHTETPAQEATFESLYLNDPFLLLKLIQDLFIPQDFLNHTEGNS